MSAVTPDDQSDQWLAVTVRNLLEERYGRGRVPGLRRISADIREANGGDTVSHGHLHNILVGDAENLTEKTRGILARFFGKHPSYFCPPNEYDEPDPNSVQALAARFATFDQTQVEAIKQAIEIVTAQTRDEKR
jgi:hypothetical protein